MPDLSVFKNVESQAAADAYVEEIKASSACSCWLKAALEEALKRDPVDAANDAEALSMILIMTPVLLPAAMGMRFDPVWFGIYMVIMVECALITPPVGLNIFIIHSMAPHVPLTETFKGILPFLAADVIRIVMLVAFPAITLGFVYLLY